jgi:Ras-related and estrogen-regulated growth inhibitor-like protein
LFRTADTVQTFASLLQVTGCLYDHIRWGEAFVIVYSVCDRNSFNDAHELLDKLGKLKLPSYFTTLLLGNKRDLDHSR